MSPRNLLLASLAFLAALSAPLSAAVVWATGAPGISTVVFTKPPSADPNLVNDPITPLVVLARAEDRGLYNLVTETLHTLNVSPAGTEWAFADLFGNPATVSAANYPSLIFDDWANALGARFALMGNIEDRPGVLHLIEEDIYLDIIFNAFGGPGSGGSFTYTRTAGPIPEPSTAALLALAALPLLRRRRSP